MKVNAAELMDEHQRGAIQIKKLLDMKKKVEAHGLKIGVALLPQTGGSQHWNIRLGRPEREQEIFDVCRTIEILGKEGICVVEYVFNLVAVFDSQTLKRLIMFSGLYPIRMAVSEDKGNTWTPLEPIGDFGGIVWLIWLN